MFNASYRPAVGLAVTKWQHIRLATSQSPTRSLIYPLSAHYFSSHITPQHGPGLVRYCRLLMFAHWETTMTAARHSCQQVALAPTSTQFQLMSLSQPGLRGVGMPYSDMQLGGWTKLRHTGTRGHAMMPSWVLSWLICQSHLVTSTTSTTYQADQSTSLWRQLRPITTMWSQPIGRGY